jgi:hypothetical protein
MKPVLKSLALVALLAGCSQGGSGAGQEPASKVNSKINGSASKALTGQTALFEVSRTLSGGDKGASRFASTMALREVMAASESSIGAKGTVQVKVGRVNSVIKQGACKVDLAKTPTAQKPSSSSDNGSITSSAADQFAPLNMKIAGGGCPIEISFNVDMKALAQNPCQEVQGGMSCRFNAVMKMNYRVLDQRLAEELGVTSGHMNLSFDIDQKMPTGQQSTSSMNMSMKGKAVVDMKAVDLEGQAYLVSGAQDVNMNMTMPSQYDQAPQIFGAMKEDLQYLHEASGTRSALSASVTMNGNSADEKYLVDGVAVTAQAYLSERDKFANSMIEFTVKNNGQEQGAGSEQIPHRNDRSQQPGGDYPQPGGGFPQPGSGFPDPNSGFPQPGSGFPQQPGDGFPQPNPIPSQPAPSTGSGSHAWVCMLDNYRTNEVFVGYGANQFVAKSMAEQACHEGENGSSCGSSISCEKQESNPNAWFCQTRNYRTGRIFNATGASKTEAGYFARSSCVSASGTDAGSCEQVSASDCSRN